MLHSIPCLYGMRHSGLRSLLHTAAISHTSDRFKKQGMELEDGWQRRQAVNVVAMLPEDAANARLVLKLALELVNTFLSDDQPLPLLAGADRNLFSISTGKALSSP